MKPHLKLESRIAARLRTDILTGRFKPGESLREERVATRFKVARGPVRESFRTLEQEGLLVARPMCGVTVAPVPDDSVERVLTPVRRLLELAALEKCLATRDHHHFAAWTPLLVRLHHACAKSDAAGVLDADFAFHEQLFHTAGQAYLVQVWRAAVVRLRWFHAQRNVCAAGDASDLLVIHFTHEKLLAHFRDGAPADALSALTSHMEDGTFNQACRSEYHT